MNIVTTGLILINLTNSKHPKNNNKREANLINRYE